MATNAEDRARPGDVAAPAGVMRAITGLWRRPTQGWSAIAAMSTRGGTLFVGLAMPLAAIGPVARMIHALVFGGETMGIIEYRPTPGGAIATALIGWIAALAVTALLVVAIDLAAPWFGGSRDRTAAARVAVYGSTPWWLAGGFAVLPGLGFLQILGLYSLVLIAIGARLLMRADRERGVFHGMIAAGSMLVLTIAALVGTGAVGHRWLRPTVKTAHGREVVVGAPAIPGSRLVAPDSGNKRTAVSPGMTALAAGVADPNSLQALLPARVGGFARTALENQSNLSAGAASADAKATYVRDTDSFTLTIADAGAPGALATNNSVIAGEVNRTTDSGYQRSHVVDGVRVIEKWSYVDHGGNYSRTVAGRFTVEAQGTAPTIDTLRAAVNAVDQRRLTALAR